MRIKKLIFLVIAGVALLNLASCNSNDEPMFENSEEHQTEMNHLAEILAKVVESHDNGTSGDTYILYDASSDEYTTMSAEDYALVNALANVIVHEDTPLTRAPEGNGWVKGGSGKGKTAAMRVAMKLANKLEEQRDFEIHVEYADDGSFTVWYRYV